jgi:hypothetical protein
MEPDRKAMPSTESIHRELINGTLWSRTVEAITTKGCLGSFVTRVKCIERNR